MPTFTLAETLPHVIVNCVFAEIALVAMVPCTPLEGLTLALNTVVVAVAPVMVHDAGGLATVYNSLEVWPWRTRVGLA